MAMKLDFSGFRPLPLIDCHVHHRVSSLIPDVVSLMDSIDIEAINVLSTPHPELVNVNPQALEFKARYPQRVYVFGSLDYSELLLQGHLPSNLAEQIGVLQDLGCDGIKMVEGLPLYRKHFPPFDGPEYQDFFAEMEARRFPLLFHVADPEEFWDEKEVPAWARARGYFYGDDPAIPSKEELYTEVSHILERHPDLRVIFAHFHFLSADLPRAARLLDAYPGVHLDICPGSEMYSNFSRQPEETREFFLTYQDRIIYGTDAAASADLLGETGPDMERDMAKHWYMHMFLETEGSFAAPPAFLQTDRTLTGIGLPEDALRKIYHDNFQRLAGTAPAPLHHPAAYSECQRLAAIVEGMGRNAHEIRRSARSLGESIP